MKNTTAIKLLKTFSKKEFKEFEGFVHSPGKSRRRDVSRHFDAVKKYYPNFDSPKFTDENVYKAILPGEKFDKARFALEAFYLFESACQFLSALEYEKNEIEQDLSLLRQLAERGMDGSFEKLAKKLDKVIVSANFQLDAFFRYRFAYEDLLMTFYIRKNDFASQFKHSLRKADCSIGLSLLRSLRSIADKFIAETYYNIEPDAVLLDMSLSNANLDKLFADSQKHPYLKLLETVYYLSRGITDKKGLKWIDRSEEAFFENFDSYSQDEKVYIFRSIMNVNQLKMNLSPDKEAVKVMNRKQYDLMKTTIEKDIYKTSKEKYMPLFLFRNILIASLENQDYKWSEKFINGYADKLKPANRNNMLNFSMALLLFDLDKFEKSLEYLSKVKYGTFLLKRDVKILLMQLYYELKLFDQAYYMHDTTYKYFKNTPDVSDDLRINNLNFLKYYSGLLKLTNEPDSVEAELTLKDIKKVPETIESWDWLAKKFEELSK